MAAASGVTSLLCSLSSIPRIRSSSRVVPLQLVADSRRGNNCCGVSARGRSSKAKDKLQAAAQSASVTGIFPETIDSSLTAPSRQRYIRDDYLVKKVSSKEVQELVRTERSVPIIVDFYATWCGPCILMAQQLEMLAVEYESNALFVKVDTDDEYEFARDMQVRGLPTLYVLSPDHTKDAVRIEGLVPPEMIKNIIDNEI